MDIKAEALNLLREHYASEAATPFSLAQLGQWFSTRGLEREPGTTLTEWARTHLEPEFVVVKDPDVPARRAVVPPGRSREVLESWASPSPVIPDQIPDLLEQLPRPLLVAFHLVPEQEDLRVYVRTSPQPIRYQVSNEPPNGDGWHEVSAKFRPNNHQFFGSLDRLSPEERGNLVERIRSWAAQAGIPIAQLVLKPEASRNQPALRKSALERLIEAQKPSMRRSLLIPADIAAILLRHR